MMHPPYRAERAKAANLAAAGQSQPNIRQHLITHYRLEWRVADTLATEAIHFDTTRPVTA